ncbi:hypothetical protein FPQ18DRAFT_387317 [Pyronema domesticum]|nr:hypothetical protein FPQ18DRAFT_387317 [Pyronema domesticum]
MAAIEVDPTVLAKPEDEDYDSAGYDTSTANEKEQDRLDPYHELMRLVWDEKLHQAPLKEPHRVLDIGTGTGIWAIDMAD